MKKITVLGSTGSIGSNALKVIEAKPEEYKVLALAAGRNVELLMNQIERFQPIVVAISEEGLANTLRGRLKGHSKTEVLSGLHCLTPFRPVQVKNSFKLLVSCCIFYNNFLNKSVTIFEICVLS